MKKIIIAIDGHSACGKSSTAKVVASFLKYAYIDTGAMYRAVTLYFLDNFVDASNPKSIDNSLLYCPYRSACTPLIGELGL